MVRLNEIEAKYKNLDYKKYYLLNQIKNKLDLEKEVLMDEMREFS
ncbi:MAG: hypothetical protein ACK5L6_10980 [Anaerorhabdus sp.]